MRLPVLSSTLALVAILARPGAGADWRAPITGVSVMAWTGGWQSLRVPSVAAPTADGEVSGDLENVFHVDWRRTGYSLRVRVTNRADAWVGRLALEIRLAPDADRMAYGYGDIPVPVPLAKAAKGQVLWAWENGVPAWVLAEGPGGSAGAIIETTNGHGFFVDRYPDGAFVLHLAVDWPKKAGETVEIAFRLVSDTTAASLRAERRRRLDIERIPPLDRAAVARLRSHGFVRVDRTGWGFVTADGRGFRVLGQNTPHLASLTPQEQDKVLGHSRSIGITVTRLLIADYAYRPLGAPNAEAYRRLLETVERCASHGIRVVICLEYSGAGQQYNLTIHRTPNWSDLYLMPEMLAFYKDTLARVVKPLHDNPAVVGWDVTNEPDLALSPPSQTLLGAWKTWLRARYGTIEALRAVWTGTDVAALDSADLPKQEDYDQQRTQQARDFVAFNGDAVGRSMVERARLVRAADPRHLITLSAWNPRLLRGIAGASVFDYWAPHTYEIYFVGPEISDQVMYQIGILRRALPDRPRPVVIEEFGLFEDPKFPETMRAQHCRAFLEAAARWGAGIMYWYDLTPAVSAEIATAAQRAAAPQTPGPELAVFVPKGEESRVLIYSQYMWRRKWGMAMATAQQAGLWVREISKTAEAAGCRALLVLGDDLAPEEAVTVRACDLPVVVTPDATAASAKLPGARMLPAERAGQAAAWRTVAGHR